MRSRNGSPCSRCRRWPPSPPTCWFSAALDHGLTAPNRNLFVVTDMQEEFFEGRTIKPFAEHVLWPDLVVGHTYFAVNFVDDDLHVPEVRPLVFIGRNLNEGDST